MLVLLPAFVGIHYLGYWIRYEFQMGPAEIERFWLSVGWVASIKVALFWRFRICRGWTRPVTFYDLVVLIRASVTSLVAMVLVDQFLLSRLMVPAAYSCWTAG